MGFKHPKTRTYVRLLGPCFKTGQIRLFCHDRKPADQQRLQVAHYNLETALRWLDGTTTIDIHWQARLSILNQIETIAKILNTANKRKEC
jgi:hypothetical protein